MEPVVPALRMQAPQASSIQQVLHCHFDQLCLIQAFVPDVKAVAMPCTCTYLGARKPTVVRAVVCVRACLLGLPG